MRKLSVLSAMLWAGTLGVACADGAGTSSPEAGGTSGLGGSSLTGGMGAQPGGGAGTGGGSAGSGGAPTAGKAGSAGMSATGGAVSTGGMPAAGEGGTSGGMAGAGASGGAIAGSAGTIGGAGVGSGGNAGAASGGNGGAGSGGTSGVSGTSGKGGSGGAGAGGASGSSGAGPGGTPPEKTLRVFYLRPTDVPFDQAYPDGIGAVVVEAQKYYREELGVTFTLNDPIVEVLDGDHPASWYTNTPIGTDSYWYTVGNMATEVKAKTGVREPDPRWKIVSVVSAVGNGGGGNGWVVLTSHDADGAAGKRSEPMSRWWGGMVHEMGHMFGLPDSSGDDGTPMSGDFYNYPDTHFSTAQKNSILNASQNAGFLN